MPVIARIIQNQLSNLRQRTRALINWRYARFTGNNRPPKAFSTHPEPRSIGSFARGQQLLSGNYLLAGELVEAGNLSLWAINPPSPAFQREQHGFAWLDDLVAVGDGKARHKAQQWVFEWIKIFGKGKAAGWQPGLTGRRMINLTSNAVFLLNGLDAKNSRKILKSMGKQVDYLSKRWHSASNGLHRFEALTGLIYAGLSLEGRDHVLQPAIKALGQQCAKHIGKDGGIASRNPEELMGIFTLLTWANKTLLENGQTADERILAAMQRIAPTLRGLRLGDGTLVRFHGGGRGLDGLLDQALADAQIKDRSTEKLMMGYQHMSAGRLALVADCAPPQANGAVAHASTLGFELSSGRRPMIVNCGSGERFGDGWPRACRKTAAHNTLQIEGVSSARFTKGKTEIDNRLFAGPDLVTCNRASDLTGVWMVATHNGYGKKYGLIHERRLFISVDGRELSGEDKLRAADKKQQAQFVRSVIDAPSTGLNFMVHFHIHPDIDASLDMDGHAVSLTLPSGEIWVFRQNGGLLALQDSVFLDHKHLKPRATKQIVISARAIDYKGRITWNFLRAADGGRNTRDLVAENPANQPS